VRGLLRRALGGALRAARGEAGPTPRTPQVERCAICFESVEPSGLVTSGELCGDPGCRQATCVACLQAYFEERVASGRFSLPPLRCAAPACGRRIPTAKWQAIALESTCAAYARSAASLFAVRCPSCDGTRNIMHQRPKADVVDVPEEEEEEEQEGGEGGEVRDTLEDIDAAEPPGKDDAEEGDDNGEVVVDQGCTFADAEEEEGTREGVVAFDHGDPLSEFGASCRDCAAVLEVWTHFTDGRIDAGALLDVLWSSGPECLKDAQPELRTARDGCPYSARDFSAWYGRARGREMWAEAGIWSAAERIADDGETYSLDQFVAWYGETRAQELWSIAPLADIQAALDAMDDFERRVVLQLGFLRRNPKIRTPCCNVRYCFRCQVAGWHRGWTCQESVAALDSEVQLCTGCGVPTVRTEGCSQMTCVCGARWQWDGHDSDGEDYSDGE